MFSGEILIVKTGWCSDGYDDEGEEEQEIHVEYLPESPDWPFKYSSMVLTGKCIKSIELL